MENDLQQSSSGGTDLLTMSYRMKQLLREYDKINDRANTIALNASVEGARTRGKIDAFSTVAEQIYTQAKRSLELGVKLEAMVGKLQGVILRLISTRYYELSQDLIDKVDRNLFERNCDVQAWATFESIRTCAEDVMSRLEGLSPEEFKAQLSKTDSVKDACKILNRLITTYCVYQDAIVCGRDGRVIGAGAKKDMLGSDCSTKEWFVAARNGELHVSDMYFDPDFNSFTVAYSMPVKSKDDAIIGVISTRFNWNYAQEIIRSAKLDDGVFAMFVNKSGHVIASTDETAIMADKVNWLDGGLKATQGKCGYSIEVARNGVPVSVGFARTKGYNAYQGKQWSSVITARLDGLKDFNHAVRVVEDRSGMTVNSSSKTATSTHQSESEEANRQLTQLMTELFEIVRQIGTVNNETRMLAINAAIQAGIAGGDGEGFAVISAEIGALAERCNTFVGNFLELGQELRRAMDTSVSDRLSDIAFDAIDKIMRNLFERFCDVQVFTAFPSLVNAAITDDKEQVAEAILMHLHRVYEVYHDILLLQKDGKIVASATHPEMRGQNQSNRKWFRDTVNGRVNVVGPYHSDTVNNVTMAFNAPLYGPGGEVVGVLSTRFNWTFISDILKAMTLDSESEIFLVNDEGKVIATRQKKTNMRESMSSLQAFQLVSQGKVGCTIDKDPQNQKEIQVGYATCDGYNTYKNSGWSVLITRPVDSDARMAVNLNLIPDPATLGVKVDQKEESADTASKSGTPKKAS